MVEVDLRGWLPLFGAPLAEPIVADILAEAEDALAPFVERAPDGAIEFDCPALLLTTAKPLTA
jgi:hypothetical protein